MDGCIALYSRANNKYVTAGSAGKTSLVARADTVGAWERFKIVNNRDGSVSFMAMANSPLGDRRGWRRPATDRARHRDRRLGGVLAQPGRHEAKS